MHRMYWGRGVDLTRPLLTPRLSRVTEMDESQPARQSTRVLVSLPIPSYGMSSVEAF